MKKSSSVLKKHGNPGLAWLTGTVATHLTQELNFPKFHKIENCRNTVLYLKKSQISDWVALVMINRVNN